MVLICLKRALNPKSPSAPEKDKPSMAHAVLTSLAAADAAAGGGAAAGAAAHVL